MMDSILIGIGGGSCSGKTTLAQILLKNLGAEKSAVILEDWYYYDFSQSFDGDGNTVNFDDPISIDFSLMQLHLLQLLKGVPIAAPIYDFKKHARLPGVQIVYPKPILIVDGLLMFSQPQLLKLFNYTIFLDISENIRFQRRLERDIRERGRNETGVLRQFMRQVKPMHSEYVEPYKNRAMYLITDEKSFNEILNILINKLK